MKKTLALFLLATSVACLVGCGAKEEPAEPLPASNGPKVEPPAGVTATGPITESAK